MVATPSSIYDTPDACEAALGHLRDMDRLAETDEWHKIENHLKRLPQLIARVPVAERRDVVVEARATVERIRDRASQSHHDISERLATLKTGRQATETYRATSALVAHTLP